MEPCTAFTQWPDTGSGKTTLCYQDRKYLPSYFYFLDAALGLCYPRGLTWAPFRRPFS